MKVLVISLVVLLSGCYSEQDFTYVSARGPGQYLAACKIEALKEASWLREKHYVKQCMLAEGFVASKP